MSCSVRADICIKEGATFDQEFTYTDPDGVHTDITGWALRSDVRVWENAPDVEFSFSCVVTDGVARKYRMYASDLITSQLGGNSYVYNLIGITPDGAVVRIKWGIVASDDLDITL